MPLIRDAGVAFAMRVGGTMLWLGYTIILAQLLSQEDFGLVLYAINFILLATPVATIGFEMVMLRFGSQYWSAGDKASFSVVLQQSRRAALAGGGCCAAALLAGAALQLDTPLTDRWLVAAIVGASAAACALMSVHRDALRSVGHLVAALMGFTIIRAFFPLVGSLGLAAAGYLTAVSALSMFLGALGCSLLFEAWRIGQSKLISASTDEHASAAARHEHWSAAKGIWPGNVAAAVFVRLDLLIVGLQTDLATTAVYGLAQRFPFIAGFFIDSARLAVGRVLAVGLGSAAAAREDVYQANSVFCLMALVGVLASIAAIAPVLYLAGEPYGDSWLICLVAALSRLGMMLSGPGNLVLVMSGHERTRNSITIIFVVVAAVSSGLVLQAYGLLAFAAVYSMIFILHEVTLGYFGHRRTGVLLGIPGVAVHLFGKRT